MNELNVLENNVQQLFAMEPPELDFSRPFQSTKRLQQNPLFETVLCDSIRHWKIFHTVPSPVVRARFRNLQNNF